MQTLVKKASELLNSKFHLEPLHHVATALNPKIKTPKMLPENERATVYDTLMCMLDNIPASKNFLVLNS